MRADQKEITNWLSKTIGNNSFNIEKLRQEASDRKYYRIKADNVSYVLTDNFDKTDQSANFDLLILGTPEKDDWLSVLLGGGKDKFVQNSVCSVLRLTIK